jgi:hypothetical protein
MRAPSLTILLLAVGLAGCGGGATVSESQCYAGDWQTLGYRDGSNGLRSTQILEHQNACVPHGVVPDRAAYMAGWRDGVTEYCRPSNGFDVGEQGYVYNNVCPDTQRLEFERAYKQGRELYLARVAVDDLQITIDQRYARLEAIKAELVTTATSQMSPTLTPAERVQLLSTTQRLLDERSAIERELPQLHAALESSSRRLAELQATFATI